MVSLGRRSVRTRKKVQKVDADSSRHCYRPPNEELSEKGHHLASKLRLQPAAEQMLPEQVWLTQWHWSVKLRGWSVRNKQTNKGSLSCESLSVSILDNRTIVSLAFSLPRFFWRPTTHPMANLLQSGRTSPSFDGGSLFRFHDLLNYDKTAGVHRFSHPLAHRKLKLLRLRFSKMDFSSCPISSTSSSNDFETALRLSENDELFMKHRLIISDFGLKQINLAIVNSPPPPGLSEGWKMTLRRGNFSREHWHFNISISI